MEQHSDIAEAVRLFGCAHTHGGRVLPRHKTAASHEEQESRLANQAGWRHEHTRFQPVRFAIEGARAYNAKVGLGDPHAHEYDHIRQDPDTVRRTGRAYDALPLHQEHALPHFEAMRKEVGDQYHHLTHTMGVNVHTVDHDPYANVHEMVHDVGQNKRLKVLGTHVTGGHSFFSNDDNDKFRAVHDFFGHAATGRDFSRHGEQAAYLAHARMFSHHALPAMTSETKGQNTSLILNGDFGPQKTAILPSEHWNHDWPEHTARLLRLATSMSPEEIVRMELGRQHVHDVDNGRSVEKLCIPHVQHAMATQPLRSGIELQVGPRHEGQCAHCLKGQPDSSTPHPWNSLPGGGIRPQQAQERRVTPADEGDEWGHGYSEGRWPHRPLKPHEQFGEFVPGIQSLNRLAVPAAGSPKVAGLRFLAHDSGDGETIFHCPFCGSGQVIARSDGTVECEFCSTAFTVQVQPQMPAFPQTIDGVPQQVPGMPAGGQGANVPPGAAPGDPNADPNDPNAPGQEEDGSDNPFADDADDGGDDSGSDDDKPAFLKGSMLYRTAAGHALDELQFMRHLALQDPTRRDRVLARIRAENGG